MANTQGPKPLAPLNSPDFTHSEAFKQTIAAANTFYQADRTLTTDDRANLFYSYRNQMFAMTAGGGIGLATGLFAPRFVCKWAGIKYKPAYASIATLITLLSGYSLGQRLSYSYYTSKYQDRDNYVVILRSLKKYPPMIGHIYYRESMQSPKYAIQDPTTIDWSLYPPFPAILSSYRWHLEHVNGAGGAIAPTGVTGTANGSVIGQGRSVDVPGSAVVNLSGGSSSSSELDTSDDIWTDEPRQQESQQISAWDRVRIQNQNASTPSNPKRYGSKPHEGDISQEITFEDDILDSEQDQENKRWS